MAETIAYCLHNVDSDVRGQLTAVETDAETVERRCLQRCGDCHRGDFLVVDGRLEADGSHADLLAAHVPEDGENR